mgnify:CR=1 FL=1
MRNSQGNALFLILIAVALFAALSYAITSSGRGGGGIDKETTSLAVAQLMQTVGGLHTAIQRLQIINDCSDTDISFIYDSDNDGDMDGDDDYRHFDLTRTDCWLFHPDGAGLSFPEIPTGINNGDPMIFTGFSFVPEVGTSASDLILFVPYLTLEACNLINKNLNAPTDNGDPIEEGSGVSDNQFYGVYVTGGGINNLDGVQGACFNGTNFGSETGVGDSYFYYSVLIAR